MGLNIVICLVAEIIEVFLQEIVSQGLEMDYIRNTNKVKQVPLKKWTEQSQKLRLLKIHSGGAPITPRGWMGVDFWDHELLLSQKIDIKILLMNGHGQTFFLSSLELVKHGPFWINFRFWLV